MKVLITGATGQLGRELQRTAPDSLDVVALGRAALDVADAGQVAWRLAALRPDVVVNTAGYSAVNQAESEPERAFAVNRDGPARLAQHALRLIHISTDFVFDGRQDHPYGPDDATNPLNVYGESKRAGELALLAAMPGNGVVVRTSWLYSAFGENFVKTILGRMRGDGRVKVVSDQTGAPTWAFLLAKVIWAIVQQPAIAGIHHWTDGGEATWYEFAVAIAEEAVKLGLLAERPDVQPVTTADFASAARRPAYSVLDCSSTHSLLNRQPEHWRVNLHSMLATLAHA